MGSKTKIKKLIKEIDARKDALCKECKAIETLIDRLEGDLDNCEEAHNSLVRARNSLSRLL